jgi:hypothetical protein
MPIIRSTEVNQQTAYDVQHWSCCVRLAEKMQVRVHLLGCEETTLHTQQVHRAVIAVDSLHPFGSGGEKSMVPQSNRRYNET